MLKLLFSTLQLESGSLHVRVIHVRLFDLTSYKSVGLVFVDEHERR